MENTSNPSPVENQPTSSNDPSSNSSQTCNDTTAESGLIEIPLKDLDPPTGPPDGNSNRGYTSDPGNSKETTEESQQVEIPIEPLDSPSGSDGKSSTTSSPQPDNCKDTTEESGQVEIPTETLDSSTGSDVKSSTTSSPQPDKWKDTTEESGQVEIPSEPLDPPTGHSDGSASPACSTHPDNEAMNSEDVVITLQPTQSYDDTTERDAEQALGSPTWFNETDAPTTYNTYPPYPIHTGYVNAMAYDVLKDWKEQEEERNRQNRCKRYLIIAIALILFPLCIPFLLILLPFKICCGDDD